MVEVVVLVLKFLDTLKTTVMNVNRIMNFLKIISFMMIQTILLLKNVGIQLLVKKLMIFIKKQKELVINL